MEYQNNSQAFVLAETYNLVPPRQIAPARKHILDPGKYEPDNKEGETTRCMTLAHWIDSTNILIQYRPADLEYEYTS